MFLDPEPTPFDLRFSVAGTPVRVNVWFWVVAAVLGWDYFARFNNIGYLALWVGCVFVSILLHELGHVWMGRAFGSWGHIVLYSFGGLAIGSRELPERWQRICVSLAGPGAQLVIYAGIRLFVIFGLPAVGENWMLPVVLAVAALQFINLWWPLLNLLPIWPLDGGQVSRELFAAASPHKGVVASLWVSLITCVVIAAHAVLAGRGVPLVPFLPPLGMYSALFFALFAFNNWQALQYEKSRWG